MVLQLDTYLLKCMSTCDNDRFIRVVSRCVQSKARRKGHLVPIALLYAVRDQMDASILRLASVKVDAARLGGLGLVGQLMVEHAARALEVLLNELRETRARAGRLVGECVQHDAVECRMCHAFGHWWRERGLRDDDRQLDGRVSAEACAEEGAGCWTGRKHGAHSVGV